MNIPFDKFVLGRSLEFTIPEVPVPQARPRLSKYGVYDPQSVQRRVAQAYIHAQMHGNAKLSGPIYMEVVFYFSPKLKNKKLANLRNGCYHNIKPDLSNLVKFLEDVCNGVVFHDDCQISYFMAKKVYSEPPRTHVTLYEIRHAPLLQKEDDDKANQEEGSQKASVS